jgi:GTP-binding protein
LHLVDASVEHAGKAYKLIRKELEAYGGGLAEKPEIVALSKVDAVDAATLKQQYDRLKRAAKRAPIKLSAATRLNVTETLRALLAIIDESHDVERAATRVAEWHP